MFRVILVLTALSACTIEVEEDRPYQEPTREDVVVPAGGTVVSLTFDDGLETHVRAAEILDAHGMRGTFYVILSRLGGEGYLTVNDLERLADHGHEIGAHTFTHRRLTELPRDEAERELCDARVALRELGFGAESFAYPFGGSSPELEGIARECGYNSARGVGGLRSPETCVDCPISESAEPRNRFEILTPNSAIPTTTLEDLQAHVEKAERAGDSWVPLVFHGVCDGCASNAVSPAVLDSFLSWLETREARGTIVATVDQIIHGNTLPSVTGPMPSRVMESGQLLANPSLERGSGLQAPECWRYGASAGETWTDTEDAFDGGHAQHVVDLSIPVKARLVSGQDMGTCAVPTRPGDRFLFAAHVKGSASMIPVAYYRTKLGDWTWWTQGSEIRDGDDWVELSWKMPAVPAEATAISVGISLLDQGAATFDSLQLSLR